jgi:uncharacterized RDD family membrane protein YckC
MKCPNCQSEQSANFKFCTNCGSELSIKIGTFEISAQRENEIRDNKTKLNDKYEYAGFWKRAGAAIIDGIIALILFPLTNFLFVYSFNNKTIMPLLVYNCILFFIIQYYSITKYGGTPGHLIVQLRTIDNSGNYLDYEHAFLRSLTYLPYTISYLLQINHSINSAPSNINIQSILDITPVLDKYGGIYTASVTLFSLLIIFDIGTVLFNKKKRAIHDFIAGSYVVTKRSLNKSENAKDELIYT